jgi:hypothetical protein
MGGQIKKIKIRGENLKKFKKLLVKFNLKNK